MIPVCPYCHKPSVLVGGMVIYPHRPDLDNKQFYLCKPCFAYVGCHPGTAKPLGRLANAELRQAKKVAHALFDPLWHGNPKSRSNAYKWLAKALGIPESECHIGMMDAGRCNAVVAACRERALERVKDVAA